MLREENPKRRKYWPHIGHLRLPTNSAPRSNKDQRGVRKRRRCQLCLSSSFNHSTTPARCIVWNPPRERGMDMAQLTRPVEMGCHRRIGFFSMDKRHAHSLDLPAATASSGRPRVPLVVLLILAVFWLWMKRVHFFIMCFYFLLQECKNDRISRYSL